MEGGDIGRAWFRARSRIGIIGWLVLPTIGATALAFAVRAASPRSETSLVFIVAVFIASSTGGVWPGLATAMLSSVAYDFFFIEPFYTLSIADPQEVLALVAFLGMAVLTGSLGGRLRRETDLARRRAATLQSLYEVAGQLSDARALGPLLETAIGQIAQAAHGSAVVLLPEGEDWVVLTSSPEMVALDASDLEAARRAARFARNMPAVAAGWPGARLEFRPVLVRGRTEAVIGFAPSVRTPAAWREADQALTALFRNIALAAERIVAEHESEKARHSAAEERLRNALLSSISHDLRTPLAAILGSITGLRQIGDALPAADRDDLMAAIEEETGRLSRFVANLLDMTRLEAGIEVRREWIDVADVVQGATARARAQFPGRAIVARLEDGLPPIRADASLLEQVLFNLVENSLRYSAVDDGPVEVDLLMGRTSALVLTVTDGGPGVPAEDLKRMFEKFYRGSRGPGQPAGAGLGLAISRGIVTALGGTICAQSPAAQGRGTRITIELPTGDPPSPTGLLP